MNCIMTQNQLFIWLQPIFHPATTPFLFCLYLYCKKRLQNHENPITQKVTQLELSFCYHRVQHPKIWGYSKNSDSNPIREKYISILKMANYSIYGIINDFLNGRYSISDQIFVAIFVIPPYFWMLNTMVTKRELQLGYFLSYRIFMVSQPFLQYKYRRNKKGVVARHKKGSNHQKSCFCVMVQFIAPFPGVIH